MFGLYYIMLIYSDELSVFVGAGAEAMVSFTARIKSDRSVDTSNVDPSKA